MTRCRVVLVCRRLRKRRMRMWPRCIPAPTRVSSACSSRSVVRARVAAFGLGRLAGRTQQHQSEQPELTAAAVAVAAALRTLPVSQRAVVIFHHVTDLPVEQVANELKVPVGTVKSRLSRVGPRSRLCSPSTRRHLMSDLTEALTRSVEGETPTTPPPFNGVDVRARCKPRSRSPPILRQLRRGV